MSSNPATRHDWRLDEVLALFDRPLLDLLFDAQTCHRVHFAQNKVQLSTLMNIKTGACSEDCAYCSQSKRHDTGLEEEPLLDVDAVITAAAAAKAQGAQRFCMGAAWRKPKARDFDALVQMVRGVKALHMETCMTLGMLAREQALALKDAGLDYYNHNLDTSEAYYPHIVSTHSYADRLQTLEYVREAGLKVCCGGIVGMGESRMDRAALLMSLANLPKHPDSVPINRLVPIAGTPLADVAPLDEFEMVRCIAVARLLMPTSDVRLSAGRHDMSAELQALCFLAGANSIFYGDKLLTTPNQPGNRDATLLERLGLAAA
jgi:biotin synthase